MRRSSAAATRFAHAPHVVWRRVEEESVILNVDTSEYYSLNGLASEIWARLGEGQPFDRIVKGLSKEYGQPEARVTKDARPFLVRLIREKLIVPAS